MTLDQAIQEVIDRISSTIREGRVVDSMLAGGIAVFIHVTKRKELLKEARYSDDIDIEFGSRMAIPDDIQVLFEDEAGTERTIVLDRNYTAALGLLHPHAFADSRKFLVSANKRLNLRLITPLDLAVTKVGRFSDHDRHDLRLLAKAGLVNAGDFRSRATEALDYYATDPTHAKLNIEEAVELIRRFSR